ncbi:MAG: right-handed parallel beta-helix repeat-containing protein, partial [Clostridia bacterium]|nr:right-handed parallel beta-helix repeat-containing protein [Clostridia bacterium]
LATTEQKLMTRSFTYFTENVPEGGTRKFADEAYKDENGNIYFVAYVDRSLIDQYFPAEQIAAKNVDIAGTELWIEIEWYYMGFRIVDIDYDHSLGIYATVDNASTVITNKNYENMYALVLNYSDASVYTKFKDGKMAPQHDVARGRDKASLKNSIYLLDEPGEYYYDLENGTVNYIPKDGEKTVGLSTVENLLILKDVANITIDGLTFTGTNNNSPTEEGYIRGQAGYSRKGTARFGTEAAIYAQSASNLTIKNCNFIDLYASGIVVRGANRNIAVTDNVFDYVGSSAILMGDPGNWDPETNALTNITIENNYMHDIAYVFYVHCAITITKVQNLAIRYNSIINCPYSGISIGWSWGKTTAPYGEYVNILGAEVAYNYIENYMSLLFDGGAIYTIGGNAAIDYPENFNLLHDNYAYCGSYEDRNVSSNTSTCWYHDGASSHWHTYNNVVWVDVKTMSKFSYISMQGGDDWKDTSGSQAYNITAENNFFLNLYQDYLTVGYGRVKTSKNLVEIDSYVLTREDPYELADQLQYMYDRGIANQHGISIKQYMLINPEAFDFVDESMATEIDGIITSAGCDRQKGRSLLTELYEYQYKHVENPGVKPN